MKSNIIEEAILAARKEKKYKRFRKILYILTLIIVVCIFTLVFFATKKDLANKLSSNNLLDSLKIENQEILWDPNKSDYSVTLKNGQKQLSIYALPDDDKAMVIINGNVNLQLGSRIEILVIAEDRSIRSYFLTVTKIEDTNTFSQIDYCDEIVDDSCIRYFNIMNQLIPIKLKHEIAIDSFGETYSLIVNDQKLFYLDNKFSIRIVGMYQDKIILAYSQNEQNYFLIINKDGKIIKRIGELDIMLGMYIKSIDSADIYIVNQYVYINGTRLDNDNKVRVNGILLNPSEVTSDIELTTWYLYDLDNNLVIKANN